MWGRSHDGHKIYKDMLQRGCSTDLILYNVYMDCTLRAGEINKAHGIFMEMKEHGCVPDARSYSILMRGLIKTGDTHAVYNPFLCYEESRLRTQCIHIQHCKYLESLVLNDAFNNWHQADSRMCKRREENRFVIS